MTQVMMSSTELFPMESNSADESDVEKGFIDDFLDGIEEDIDVDIDIDVNDFFDFCRFTTNDGTKSDDDFKDMEDNSEINSKTNSETNSKMNLEKTFEISSKMMMCSASPSSSSSSSLLSSNAVIPLHKGLHLSPDILWKLDELKAKHDRHVYKFDDFAEILHLSYPYEVMKKMGDGPHQYLVKFTKDYNGFDILSEDDQVALIREGFYEILLLTSAMVADEEGTHWVYEDKKNRVTKWNIWHSFQHGFGEYYNSYQQLLKSGPKNWHKDNKLCLLLFGILLFNPDRKNVRNKAAVWRNQQFCYDLLHRYLAKTSSEQDPGHIFLAMIEIMTNFREMAKKWRRDMTEKEPEIKRWLLQNGSRLMLELYGLIDCK